MNGEQAVVERDSSKHNQLPDTWPARPHQFPELMRPIEAAQYLRLDELENQSPRSAMRTLRYWRDRGDLKATKYAKHVWYLKTELDRFLSVKTET